MTSTRPDIPFQAVLATVLLCGFSLLAPAPGSGAELTLLYGNDIRGETEPCG